LKAFPANNYRQKPTTAAFNKLLARGRKLAKEKGISPKDIDKAIADARNANRH
jgi:hypothetical protein